MIMEGSEACFTKTLLLQARSAQLAKMAERQTRQAAVAQHTPPTKRWIDPAIIERNFRCARRAVDAAHPGCHHPEKGGPSEDTAFMAVERRGRQRRSGSASACQETVCLDFAV